MAKHINERILHNFAQGGFSTPVPHGAWTPNTDVFETADALVVKLELAGVTKADVEISLTDRLLVVRGNRQETCRQCRCTYRQLEIDYGYFERRLVLPHLVDGRHAQARLQDGFLRIELPKALKSPATLVHVVIGLIG